ncbi:iron-sulfur cluster-binding oxidoreductase [Desulfuromonas soudanensis]|uniref:Iron-sulfur cluster-binding oxidoreductase n=1 Tax=Desulfuromonas soudanensis TaxID=1603606 RepID=A0A0M4D7F6_9BACT|nr:YkgJ family cysteine cluster protein [Desulfuromonas soudanensis]ALC17060.1 iron-sulfur cluster-binding oxidoreductase [Desulfuromonas soudanensis]
MLLENYRHLVGRVDALCRRIEAAYGQHLACRKGCDSCCRHLSLFRVEGVALARALAGQDPGLVTRIRERARKATPDGPCPLLEDGACLLYAARPMICRTHGLPLIFSEGEGRRVDFCPQNFQGLASLPASSVVDLDLLNATLATIDELFVAEAFQGTPPGGERLSIAEALLLQGD